jgi:hypothetical protein
MGTLNFAVNLNLEKTLNYGPISALGDLSRR